MALTMSSTAFLASPYTLMVLSMRNRSSSRPAHPESMLRLDHQDRARLADPEHRDAVDPAARNGGGRVHHVVGTQHHIVSGKLAV
jgi:hypothetical protein